MTKKKGTKSATNKIPQKKPPKQPKHNDLVRVESSFPHQEIRLTFDIPPSVNHMYFTTRNGMRVLKKDAKIFFDNIKDVCQKEIKKQGWVKEDEGVWYYVDLFFYFKDRKKRDTHNCLKILLDAIEGEVYPNDYYILPRIQDAKMDKGSPRVELIITPKIA